MACPILNYPEWHNQPLNLTKEEIKDPFFIFSAFFDCYKLPQSRICLQQWLEDALQREDVDARNLFVLHSNIVRLVEASWLILQQQPSLSLILNKHEGSSIDAVLKLIITAIDPERIFLVSLDPLDLLIIMPNKAQRRFEEYESLIEFALINQEAITFSVLRSADLFSQLQQGHFFYSKICTAANAIYASGKAPELPLATAILDDKKAEAKRQFEPGFKRAVEFLQAAKLHYRQGGKVLAAFMLHQAAELGIRALILALTGQEIRSHDINILKKHCTRYVPSLKSVFHDSKGDQFVTFLNRVYKCARYSPTYEVSEDELELINGKVALLLQRIEEALNEMVGYVRQQY